jgi:hypothetical protein
MNWYDYVACFFAGAFLANCVPHFVHGISGDRFPTPFASPPGRGLSSPTVNVIWGLFNLAIGAVLFHIERAWVRHHQGCAVFFAGLLVIGIWLSLLFSKKEK